MPANTRDIRRRIKSIKSTAQITKAMQMVSAAKMRRAQGSALAGRPYAELLNRVLVSVQRHAEVTLHPLLEVRGGGRELVLVVSTDKGLCGGLNTNLFRELGALKTDAQFVTTGRKAQQFVARTRRNLVADFSLADTPDFRATKTISRFCMEQFLAGKIDSVKVLYTHFINTLSQEPVVRTLLPICPFALSEKTAQAAADDDQNDYLYEPNAGEVLGAILPHYIHFEIYQMILDARASEQSARMVAMKNATDNAKQLVADLTLQYNKVRQAGITTELLEISTAQMALG